MWKKMEVNFHLSKLKWRKCWIYHKLFSFSFFFFSFITFSKTVKWQDFPNHTFFFFLIQSILVMFSFSSSYFINSEYKEQTFLLVSYAYCIAFSPEPEVVNREKAHKKVKDEKISQWNRKCSEKTVQEVLHFKFAVIAASFVLLICSWIVLLWIFVAFLFCWFICLLQITYPLPFFLMSVII